MRKLLFGLLIALSTSALADPVSGGQKVGSPEACQWVCGPPVIVQGVSFPGPCHKVC